jgi:hypothetical protein
MTANDVRDRTAQRPHVITIVLSLAALVVSCFALWTSRDSLQIAKKSYQNATAANASAVELGSVEVRAGWQYQPFPNQSDIALTYTVQNLGRMQASGVSVHFVLNFFFSKDEQGHSVGDSTLPVFHIVDTLVSGAKRSLEADLSTDNLATSISKMSEFSGEVHGVNLVAEIEFSDEQGPHKLLQCFYKRANEIPPKPNESRLAGAPRQFVIEPGPIATCDESERRYFVPKSRPTQNSHFQPSG